MKILIFDDEPALAEVTARRLRREGLEAEVGDLTGGFAWGGEILVVDLGLLLEQPDEVAQAIYAARPIIVTGARHPEGLLPDHAHMTTALLGKPVRLSDLLTAIGTGSH